MTLTCFPVPGKEKSKVICHAFKAGAPAHASGAVFFGTEGVMDAYQRAKSGTWWYIDNSYFDRCRGTYFRVTKNALQVDVRPTLSDRGPIGTMPNDAVPIADGWLRPSTGERFARLGVPVRPARLLDPHGRVLVIPQSNSFMKSTLGRRGDWTAETLRHLVVNCGLREHEIHVRPWLRDKKQAYIELRDELPSARLVVTWSSASAITALLEGVPAISESGSAHWLTGTLTPENVYSGHLPQYELRLRFAQVLADNQFTLDEFRDGTAWRWLERDA